MRPLVQVAEWISDKRRLSLAAPELLQSLKDMFFLHTTTLAPPDPTSLAARKIDKARAALAKAKGGVA